MALAVPLAAPFAVPLAAPEMPDSEPLALPAALPATLPAPFALPAIPLVADDAFRADTVELECELGHLLCAQVRPPAVGGGGP